MSEEKLPQETEEKEATGLPEEEFSHLMGSISAMAPLAKQFLGGTPFGKKSQQCERREALLMALKPYLSPTRCEAVDYLIRMSRISDTLHGFQQGGK